MTARSSWFLAFSGLLLLLTAHVARADEQKIREQLERLQPDVVIERISVVEGSGLYQVQLADGQFLYTDKTAGFILHGELYQVTAGQAVSLTGLARQAYTAKLIQGVQLEDMVVFPAAKGDKKAVVTVFTDVDCGYCQRLHADVEELNREGVEVRYLAWPRQGLSGSTYERMVSIWCADDRQQAMTNAKRREPVDTATCRHPVDRQHALGRQLGIRGTPAIVLENGELVPGYLPAEQLVTQALQAK